VSHVSQVRNFLAETIVTTKQARYQFKVKEGVDNPFIIAEPSGREPVGDRPLTDPDFLAFGLRPGISLGEAGRIADFLNEHLPYVTITRFGDVEDIVREGTQDARRHTMMEEA
jgi:hypothetical protein